MTTDQEVPEVAVTLPPPRFENPFKGLKNDPTAATVNCMMPKEVFNRIKACRLEGGTIQTTMNLLWIKLVNLLNQKGIESYADVREFEDAVKRSILVMPEDLGTTGGGSGGSVPGVPTPLPNTAANVVDDPGAVERIRNLAPSEPQQSDVPSDTDKGSGKGDKSKSRTKRGKGKSNA